MWYFSYGYSNPFLYAVRIWGKALQACLFRERSSRSWFSNNRLGTSLPRFSLSYLACLLAFALATLATAQGNGNESGVSAAYSGNADAVSATSPALDQAVPSSTSDYTLSITPDNATIYTGARTSFTIVATPVNGFDQPLVLSCSSLPANAQCVFAPDLIQLHPPIGQEFYLPYTSTLALETSSPKPAVSTARLKQAGWTGGAAALAGLCGFLMIPRRIRKKYLRALQMQSVLIAAILLGAFSALSGCSGGGTLTGGTPPGTYMINVTAKLYGNVPQQLIHSVTIKLVVKSLF
jgi:hypothetical protein